MNNWKGRITERLIHCYIDDVLIRMMRKQGWDDALYTSHTWCGDDIKENEDRPDKWKLSPVHMEVRFLVTHGLFPTKRFLTVFRKLITQLENLPDGLLIKIRKTGRTKPLKEAIREFQLDNWVVSSYDYRERNENEKLPVVDGDIEVIEIKSDKATLPSRQKRSYERILNEGYVLRFFHVNIISFEKNEFEIEEKLIAAPCKLRTFPTKDDAIR